jgi:hypothetical protein
MGRNEYACESYGGINVRQVFEFCMTDGSVASLNHPAISSVGQKNVIGGLERLIKRCFVLLFLEQGRLHLDRGLLPRSNWSAVFGISVNRNFLLYFPIRLPPNPSLPLSLPYAILFRHPKICTASVSSDATNAKQTRVS